MALLYSRYSKHLLACSFICQINGKLYLWRVPYIFGFIYWPTTLEKLVPYVLNPYPPTEKFCKFLRLHDCYLLLHPSLLNYQFHCHYYHLFYHFFFRISKSSLPVKLYCMYLHVRSSSK